MKIDQPDQFACWKTYHVNHYFIGFALADGVRRASHLAAQQKLGLLSERRIGCGSIDSNCPDDARQNLNGAAYALQTKGENVTKY